MQRNDGGHGTVLADALKDAYDNAVEVGVTAGGSSDASKGLNAIKEGGIDVPNAEGLAMCVKLEDDDLEAFYWVPNCNIFAGFCSSLTTDEALLGGVGYVVDATLHNDDGGFHRYAFNGTYAIKTEYQSPTLSSSGVRCSEMGWFQTGLCLHPLATTCPTMGSRGRDANQYYGSLETGIVVGVQLREGDLAPCLDNTHLITKKSAKKGKNSKKGGKKNPNT